MTWRITAIAAMSAFLSLQGALACDKPVKIDVPEGSRAAEAELIAADASLKLYMAAMYDYLQCLEAETTAMQTDSPTRDIESARQREDQAVELHNTAAEEMKQVLAEFDKAVQDYTSRQGS